MSVLFKNVTYLSSIETMRGQERVSDMFHEKNMILKASSSAYGAQGCLLCEFDACSF